MGKTIYPLGNGEYLSADLTKASAPLWFGIRSADDEGELVTLGNGRAVRIFWTPTPYQTADARHQLSRAKTLVKTYLDGKPPHG